MLTIGIEPPSRMNTGARPKPVSIAAGRGTNIRTVERHDHARCAVEVDQLHADAGRQRELRGTVRSAVEILCGILVGHEAEAELGAGPGGQHGLGAFALVAAREAVDVARRPGPAAFERGVAGFARRVPSTPSCSHELGFVEWQVARTAARSASVSGTTSS